MYIQHICDRSASNVLHVHIQIPLDFDVTSKCIIDTVMHMNKPQIITEVCKMLDLTTRTIRYYEQLGLIQTVRSSKTAPRRLDDENIERLRKIRFLRKIGLSLDEIKDVIGSDQDAEALIRDKTAVLSAEITSLFDRIRMLECVLAAAEQGESIYAAEKQLRQPPDDPENLRIAAEVTKLLLERRFAEIPPYMNADMRKLPEFYAACWDSHIKPCGSFKYVGTQSMDGSTILNHLHYEKLGVRIRMDVCGGLIAGLLLQYFKEES